MPDASPTKWHLAHITWFFETFVLARFAADYAPFDARFGFLFNSYYESVGARHPRPQRGLLTRPTLVEVLAYRAHVDAAMAELLSGALAPEVPELVELGIQHEQQHQELLLTDILHLFAQNPLKPAWRNVPVLAAGSAGPETNWIAFPGARVWVGHDASLDGAFAFDCETPRHEVLLRPYALASRPVLNRDWLAFMEDGGYRTARWWLSDGWSTVQQQGWQAPLYWRRDDDGAWVQMTLAGERSIDPEAPVVHVSYFEADAYAHWAGGRLPTEFEWENAARAQAESQDAANFASSGRFRPGADHADRQAPLHQLFGDVWEWTASPYVAYPGFRTAPGAVGEYNGKFMNGQFVLRGGSCATPGGHIRASYRNFFYPHQRWQFSGLRLAKDME